MCITRCARWNARGADAIQLEDQGDAEKCGHFSGKQVVSAGEMVGKIHAATDAREDANFQIIARTDAGGRMVSRTRSNGLPICRGGRRYPVP
jgi:2-methylisocitrate lyase-like PEP mutase family enzyme